MNSDHPPLSRRRVLACVGAAATASVAGCSSLPTGGSTATGPQAGTDSPPPTDSPTPTERPERTLLATDFEDGSLAGWATVASSEEDAVVEVNDADELVVGVYRCNEAVATYALGEASGELQFTCAWETEAEQWWENPGVRILADGDPVEYDVQSGEDVGSPDKGSTRRSEMTATAAVDGALELEFSVRPSNKCANNNHGWTWLRVDRVNAVVDPS